MRYQSRPRPLYQTPKRSMRRWVCCQDPTSLLCWSLAFFIVLFYIALNAPDDSALDIMRYVKRQADIGPHLQQRLLKLTKDFTLDPNDTDIIGYKGADEKGVKLMLDLTDLRLPQCKDIKYNLNKKRPVSVIITFHDQPWYLLLWTINSVLFKTPYHLLKEIILVDDCSSKRYMKEALDNYVYNLPKTRLIRAKACQGGPSGSQMLGARAARGDVLVFLDGHAHVGEGWLEPLLAVIQDSPRGIVVPNIVMMYPGFQDQLVRPVEPRRGGFTWDLRFVSRPVDRHTGSEYLSTEPYSTPTHQGAMFAVGRQFFLRIGGFDDGVNTVVSENLELSFRAWLCADGVQVAPCSHVVHLFTYGFNHRQRYSGGLKESQRTADIWLGENRNYYYAAAAQTHAYTVEETNSIHERREMYRRMRCRSFDWFIKRFVPDMFAPLSHVVYQGHMRNLGSDRCLSLDISTGNLLMDQCLDNHNQYFFLSNDDRIFVNQTHCISFLRFQAFVVNCEGTLNKAVQWDASSELPEMVRPKAQKPENVLHFRSRRTPEHPQCFTHITENGVEVGAAWPCSEHHGHAYWEFDYQMDFTRHSPELNSVVVSNSSVRLYDHLHMYLYILIMITLLPSFS